MTKAEVVRIITQLGFEPKGKPKTSGDNDSFYQAYTRNNKTQLWLGSAFIEADHQIEALDYRHATKAELRSFIFRA